MELLKGVGGEKKGRNGPDNLNSLKARIGNGFPKSFLFLPARSLLQATRHLFSSVSPAIGSFSQVLATPLAAPPLAAAFAGVQKDCGHAVMWHGPADMEIISGTLTHNGGVGIGGMHSFLKSPPPPLRKWFYAE